MNVLFPETSNYYLLSVGFKILFKWEKHENHSKYPKNRKKKTQMSQKN